MDDVTVVSCDLDEALAHALLGMNTSNRPQKRGAVAKYTDDIINGRWQFNGEPIKVAVDGTLLDGQNRCLALLAACERTEQPLSIPVLLVSGLPLESQDTMDSGTGRSLGDQLARRGISTYAATAAMVRAIVMFKNGERVDAGYRSPTKAKMLAFHDANGAAIADAIGQCPEHGNTSGIHMSVQGAARYLIGEVCGDSDAVEAFFHGLRVGADLPEGDPILALRTRALGLKQDRETVPNITLLQLVLRAWNYWRTGEQVTKLPLRMRGKVVTVQKIET